MQHCDTRTSDDGIPYNQANNRRLVADVTVVDVRQSPTPLGRCSRGPNQAEHSHREYVIT